MRLFIVIALLSITFFADCVIGETPTPAMLPQTDQSQHEIEYNALVKELNVRKKQHLIFCSATKEGLQTIDAFLETYTTSEHREEVLYLAAIARWNLFQYEDAAIAYQEFLHEFPHARLATLSMARLSQSHIRSDNATKAIEALDNYKNSPAADQREFHRADALALQGKIKEAKILLESLIMGLQLASKSDRMLANAEAQLERLEMVGKTLPPFQKTIFGSGKPLTQNTYKGKVLLIDFWASWCRPCMGQMPELVDTYEEFRQDGFEILGISLDDDESKMKNALRKVGATWPQYFDGKKWKNDLAVLFDVHRIPMTILIGRDGTIQSVDPPPLAVKRMINDLLTQ